MCMVYIIFAKCISTMRRSLIEQPADNHVLMLVKTGLSIATLLLVPPKLHPPTTPQEMARA